MHLKRNFIDLHIWVHEIEVVHLLDGNQSRSFIHCNNAESKGMASAGVHHNFWREYFSESDEEIWQMVGGRQGIQIANKNVHKLT